MSEEWFRQQLAPDGSTEDGCHPDEGQALKDYLSQKLTPDEAAKAITKPISTSSSPKSDLPRLWNLLSNALVELPSPKEAVDSQQPLLKLIRAIEALPQPDMSGVAEDEMPVHGPLWSGLPGFGHQWADENVSYQWHWTAKSRPRLGDLSEDDLTALRARHARRCEIEARLAMEGLAGIPMDWGYECVADALERSDAVVDFEVLGACQWLKIAGRRMREEADRGYKSWALEKERDLFKANEGGIMTPERWQFWVGRLSSMDSEVPLALPQGQMSSVTKDAVVLARNQIRLKD